MATISKYHALVVGASGLTGWSIVNQLLQPYPSPSPFGKITALVNRPLNQKDAFWPDGDDTLGRPRLALVQGVNLLEKDEEVETLLKKEVEDVRNVTHVFYFAFKDDEDAEKEVTINVSMMRKVVRSVASLSSHLKFFVYPGGTRGYGIYRPEGIFTAPLTEDMADQLPQDYARTVSYPHYRALLASESKNQRWTWCELCPDAIIGFTPNGSGYSLAGHWAMYLHTYKIVHGAGAEVPFPGTLKGYDAKFTEVSAGILARIAIHTSLHPDKFQEKIFNVADSATISTMRERWPQIASWFGLKGVPPLETASVEDTKPSEFIKEHDGVLVRDGVKGIGVWHSEQLDSVGYWLTFDRQLSLERLREAGFEEERKPEEGWWEAFEMFKRAGMI